MQSASDEVVRHHERLAAQTHARHEPIAIVGIGCRFPGGANNATAFWELLAAGQDGMVDVPQDRWDIKRFYSADREQPAKMYVRKGGFLREAIDRFDPLFFGISPREAEYMDPQQRLLLELTWEALEDGGLPATHIAGTDVGVYIGGFALDNMVQQLSPLSRELIRSHYAATAASMTMLAARISYTFDLRGPSIVVDTACSSSLVAFHYACQAIWHGDCSLALAGGVNIMLRPELTMVMCKGRFLAPDGYCKAFDERADGYARGEGGGVVVLKPLSAALADGDDVYALVRATGVNQDGRTDGITVPRAAAQEALIRSVCARAQVALDEVAYVEAHGTGTPVGDPVEARALGDSIGKGRTERDRCFIGSVKANIGHLEAAAGIAGVIKACLCLKHRHVPAQLNVNRPNPAIPFAELGLRLPSRLEPLPEDKRPIYVGVNSFGYGGTNAHALLQEQPQAADPPAAHEPPSARPYLLPISARSQAALGALVQSYRALLSSSAPPALADLCYSASVRRLHFEHRFAVVADTVHGVAERLAGYPSSDWTERLASVRVTAGQEPKMVFVFTGMGPQWWGMGRELLRDEPVFRATAVACDDVFRQIAGWSILAEMQAEECRSRMQETRIAQPANFVLQLALAALWQSWGIKPAAVVGHSVGEVAAACIGGALELDDAVLVVYHRSRLQHTAAGAGRMLAVGVPVETAHTLVSGREQQISVAAVNSPSAVTLSGDSGTLEALTRELAARDIFHRLLQVDVAYHSPQMERLKDEFQRALQGLRPRTPAIPIYSTVSGANERESYDADYWYRNIRAPVLFAAAVDRLSASGYALFLEIGPHPVLGGYIQECCARRGAPSAVVASLRRREPERAQMLGALGGLYAHGVTVDWRKLFASPRRHVRLPTYPWQRERYWLETDAASADRLGDNVAHPLLGVPMAVAIPTWETDLNPNYAPYLSDHVVAGLVVLPAAAGLEAGLAIHALRDASEPALIEQLEFLQALAIEPANGVRLQWTYDERTRMFRACSTRSSSAVAEWTRHIVGRISPAAPTTVACIDLGTRRAECEERIGADDVYERLRLRGLQYGPSFRCIRELWRTRGQVVAQLRLREAESAEAHGYHVHPALLDAALQSLIAALDVGEDDGRTTYVPVQIDQVRYFARPGASCWCCGTLARRSDAALQAELALCDDHGEVLLVLEGLRCAALPAHAPDASARMAQWLYTLQWCEAPPVAAFADPARWLLLADAGGIGAALAQRLQAQGAAEVVFVATGSAYEQESPGRFRIRRHRRDDLERVLATDEATNCRAVVTLWGIDSLDQDEDPAGTEAAIDVLHLVQALTENAAAKRPRLYVITRGAQQVGPQELVTGLPQAASVGIARVAASEHPDLKCTLVDLDPADSAAERLLASELLADSPEDDVALRGANRYVQRVSLASLEEFESAAANRSWVEAQAGAAFALEVGTPGLIDSLRFRAVPRREPQADEVEIKVRAAALNFKDVLKVLRALPPQALDGTYHGSSLGMEAAGVITQVGDGVRNYRVGDAIVASLRGSFSSHVVVRADAALAAPQPKFLTPAQAAGLPVAYLTAYYALHKVARLCAGETVLIHGATGGVGLAAIQVAKWLGAEIYATAGSELKRECLRELGVHQVWDSRSFDFAEGVTRATQGRGVDVVLNSLPGEALLKSLAVTAPFGRFVDLGKRDIVENTGLPLTYFNRSLSFVAIDLDRMMAERPDSVREALTEVWERLCAGDFAPLPAKVFPAARIAEAFRHMAQSKQIGKVVVDIEDLANLRLRPSREGEQLFRADATYLVTGGFGGIGLELARWLAERGVRHLVLAGRQGPARAQAQRVVAELAAMGVSVLAACADMSQADQVAALLRRIADGMPPLRGVFHAAAVLDDALLANLDGARLARVMAAKAHSAWHLHQCTASLQLDYFVLFSSATSLLGNPGQGNYVAANTFLDLLARHRRAAGLAATSINWGAFAEVGMLAERADVAEHLARMGIRALSTSTAMAALERILQWNPTQLAVADIDWEVWRGRQPAAQAKPRFSNLPGGVEGAGQALAAGDFRAALWAVRPDQRLERLATGIAEVIAKALHMPPERIDVHQPLTEMGIDSLLGMELQAAMSAKLGVQISVLELLKGDHILGLARHVLKKMTAPA